MTLRLTSPRSCASAIMELRLVRIFRTIAGDRASPSAAPGAGCPIKQRILEVTNQRDAQMRKLHPPKIGHDVQLDMLPILGERRSVRDCGSRMRSTERCAASATVMLRDSGVCVPRLTSIRNAGMIGVRLPLRPEGLDVPLAVLIDVIDEPSLSLGASLSQVRLQLTLCVPLPLA